MRRAKQVARAMAVTLDIRELLEMAGFRAATDAGGRVEVNDETGAPTQVLGEGQTITIRFDREG